MENIEEVYKDVRPTIKSGDILAWTHKSWKSWYDIKIMIVRLMQLSEYCHVGIAVVGQDRVWIVESVTPLVRIVPLSGELPCYVITGNGLTDKQRLKAISMIGKAEYSQWEAIKAFFKGNTLNDDRLQCAEFVAEILDLPCKATPSSIVDYKLSQGASLIKVAE